jgi:hypothetical protein
MKVSLNVTYNYGGWHLWFKKDVVLPFAPFYGLGIELDDDGEIIRLENTKYTTTFIDYNVKSESFYVEIREAWAMNIAVSVVEDAINKHENWVRMDNTNTEKLIELINKQNG